MARLMEKKTGKVIDVAHSVDVREILAAGDYDYADLVVAKSVVEPEEVVEDLISEVEPDEEGAHKAPTHRRRTR